MTETEKNDAPEQVPSKRDLPFLFVGIIAVAVIAVFFFVYYYKSKESAALTQAKPLQDLEAALPKFSDKVQDIPISKSAYAGLGEDFRKGSDDAKVVVVEFSDLQCPACSYNARVMKRLADEFGGKILVVYRNYPLDSSCNSSVASQMHPEACRLAVLARCAGQYGKFWPYHDLVFERSRDISKENTSKWALEVGLTSSQIEACLSNESLLEKIKDDVTLGNKIGVDGTPTIFINGRKYLGPRNFEVLQDEITNLL